MSDGSTEAKIHDASARKLKKQRGEGQVASSVQSAGLVAVAVAIAFLAAMAISIWAGLATLVTSTLDLIVDPFPEARNAAVTTALWTFFWTVVPATGLTIATAFLTSLLYNKGILFSLKPVAPQLNRISVLTGFKRIYGRRGLLETATALARIVIWVGFVLLAGILPFRSLLYQWTCSTECMTVEMTEVFLLLTIGAVICMLVAAAIDMLIQKSIYLGEQKMTETERRRERRDQQGSPEVRKELMRLRKTTDMPPRKTGAKHANMCFYSSAGAVGVEFKPPEMRLPYLVAKATAEAEAKTLRVTITQTGWPEMEHGELTRALLAAPVGEVISDDLIPAFAETLTILFARRS